MEQTVKNMQKIKPFHLLQKSLNTLYLVLGTFLFLSIQCFSQTQTIYWGEKNGVKEISSEKLKEINSKANTTIAILKGNLYINGLSDTIQLANWKFYTDTATYNSRIYISNTNIMCIDCEKEYYELENTYRNIELRKEREVLTKGDSFNLKILKVIIENGGYDKSRIITNGYFKTQIIANDLLAGFKEVISPEKLQAFKLTTTDSIPVRFLNTGIDTLNLVPNFSFEIIDSCPSSPDSRLFLAGWNYKIPSPDLFAKCVPYGSAGSIPKNFRGYQNALPNHNNYMGEVVAISNSTIPEITGVSLISPLDSGKTYYGGFKMVLSEKSDLYTNKTGILLTMNPINSHTRPNNYNAPNRSHIYSDSLVLDTLNWTPVFGKFVADSAYRYINISNFFSTQRTLMPTPWSSTVMISCAACYYFDDIVISEDSAYAYETVYGGITSARNTNNITKKPEEKTKLYPNPTNGLVTVVTSESGNLQIYNSIGVLVKDLSLNPSPKERDFSAKYETEVDLSNLVNGVYLFRIGNESIKLVKE
jgi:hypothetical protein